MATQKI